MPKIRVKLNGNSLTKLKRFFKRLSKTNAIFDNDEFRDEFTSKIINEVKSIKDCTEKSIVDAYILYGEEYLLEYNKYPISPIVYDHIRDDSRNLLLKEYTDKSFDNNIDIYFNDVKKEYILHPQNESDELEFVAENRDIFIKNNLKLVVSCAKRYQNLGIPFEDLIQIGNVGLLTAFDKFDTSRSCLRSAIIKDIESHDNDIFSADEASEIISKNFNYDKLLDKTLKCIPEEGFDSKDAFINWVKKNIKTAVFASVAFQWIRAYILQELDKYSNTIRFPKSQKEEGVASMIRLDSINPYTNDNYTDNELAEITMEEFIKEDEQMINKERDEFFNDVITNALSGLSIIERRIVKKKFGIGFPYALQNQEIAESENMTNAEVKNIITRSLEYISNVIPKETKDLIYEMMT